MSHRSYDLNRRGFTLIEMLVVIAIITVLAGLLFPAVSKGILTAKRNKAAAEAKSIAGAIDMFYRDYGWMPDRPADQGFDDSEEDIDNQAEQSYFDEITPSDSNAPVTERIVAVLMAEPGTENVNPRKKVYLDLDTPITNKLILDPWGQPYVIKLDRNFDGKVEYFSQPSQYNTRSIVISAGADRNILNFDDNVASVILNIN
ncbi:MAG: type II secretion system protein [Kiritimatiellia bacterium]